MNKDDDFKNTKALIKEQEITAAVIAGILLAVAVSLLVIVVF
jgi:uncharacterized membrane protein